MPPSRNVSACADYATSQPWQVYAIPAPAALTETLLYSPDGQAAWGDPLCGASWSWDQTLGSPEKTAPTGAYRLKVYALDGSLYSADFTLSEAPPHTPTPPGPTPTPSPTATPPPPPCDGACLLEAGDAIKGIVPITLTNTAAWSVDITPLEWQVESVTADASGVVYGPVPVVTQTTTLSAGGIITWTWDSRSNSGSDAPQGQYKVVLVEGAGEIQTGSVAGGLAPETQAGSETSYYYLGQTRVAMREGAIGQWGRATLYYLHADHLGSLSSVWDAAGGSTPMAEQKFFPFGAIRSSSGTMPTDYGFTGQRRDATTELMFYQSRYYDPFVARFLQADTIVPGAGNPQYLNRYSYSGNNPILYTDPTGHCPWCITIIGGAIVGALFSYGAQVVSNMQSGMDLGSAMTTNIDPGKIVVGAVTGAVSGATFGAATAVMGTGFAAGVAASAVSSAVTGQAAIIAENAIAGRDLTTGVGNPADMVRDAASGAVSAVGGYVIGKAISAVASKVGKALNFQGGCSFTQDTPVLSEEGLVAIGEVKVGDQVWAWDETSGLTGVYTVTAVLLNYDPVQTALVISGEVIATTPEHPFWSVERGWVAAGELRIGEHVRGWDGTVGEVEGRVTWPEARWMYNLTVATAHTYFVGQGQWLVHNASCGVPEEHLLSPGPYAKESIPASGPKATPAERAQIQELGNKYGCHSCGAKEPGGSRNKWIPDHQPPTALANGESQRLYPQCWDCSQSQSHAVRRLRFRLRQSQ